MSLPALFCGITNGHEAYKLIIDYVFTGIGALCTVASIIGACKSNKYYKMSKNITLFANSNVAYLESQKIILLFSEVGVKRKMSGLDYSLAYSKLFREMIIRHAHRYVYADRPQKGMLALNARVVNRDIYEYEQQSIAGWHIENMEAERRLLDC